MPKYRPETAKAKAKKLAKEYIDAGLNQSELARRKGVSKVTIHKKLTKAIVVKTIAEIFRAHGIHEEAIATGMKKGFKLKAGANHHRYLYTALEVLKHVKADEESKPMTLIVECNYRKPKADAGT